MFLIGIAGGSGSGKTTFAKKILQRANEAVSAGLVGILHQDSYYLETPPAELRVHGEPNFDHPDAFDWELLKKHLQKLKNGESVQAPRYDYDKGRRFDKTELIGPCHTVLFEGIYSLWEKEIRTLFDIKVYLHVESDIRFIRRLHRDVRERGRTLDGIIRQYYDTVRPMHQQFLDPTRQYADLVVGEETDIAAEVLAARVAEVCEAELGQSKNEEIFF